MLRYKVQFRFKSSLVRAELPGVKCNNQQTTVGAHCLGMSWAGDLLFVLALRTGGGWLLSGMLQVGGSARKIILSYLSIFFCTTFSIILF